MADVQPFRAIRYHDAQAGDLTGRLAPPYDVLSEADKRRLLEADPHNIVAIDLPHTPPKSAGPAEAYAKAADLLADWLAQSVLVREDRPAIYAYQQSFEDRGQRRVRRGFIARVRAEPFRASPTGIFPHEQTFSGPKEDRLALTRAARCQLSPIFGLFADEGNRITDRLYAGLSASPDLRGRVGQVQHEAWIVTDPAVVGPLVEAMAERPIFIADGHHRYTTALNYLAELERDGQLPADHPARFVMFTCVSMHDPGLAIQPTHRVLTLPRLEADRLIARLGDVFDIQPAHGSVEQIEAAVLAGGPGWFGLKLADGPGFLMHLRNARVLDELAGERGEAWRRLDVAVLHRYIIEEVLASLGVSPAGVEYPHSGVDAAAALARTGIDAATAFGSAGGSAAAGPWTKAAFLLAPTPLEAVREVCLSGELMPQKSTFFYPKLATGLTLYKLA